jgi:hypothetical protein
VSAGRDIEHARTEARGSRAGRRRAAGPDRDFDPRPLREALLPLLRAIEALPDRLPDPLPPDVMEPLLRRHARPGGGFFSRSELIAGFRAFADEAGLRFDEGRFRRRVQRRPVRTQSGVTPLTVLTSPAPSALRTTASTPTARPGAGSPPSTRSDTRSTRSS